MIGVAIGEERENQIMASIEARADARRRRKEFSTEAELEASYADGDDGEILFLASSRQTLCAGRDEANELFIQVIQYAPLKHVDLPATGVPP
ncbi:MAG: hypothetical protein H0T87_14175 [Gammaproteobacteria bacterium]|nr:hypothetical protein [Gammaproteobacteria bacterium]